MFSVPALDGARALDTLSTVFLKMTIEYGYVPFLALLWSALIVAFGWKITVMAKDAD